MEITKKRYIGELVLLAFIVLLCKGRSSFAALNENAGSIIWLKITQQSRFTVGEPSSLADKSMFAVEMLYRRSIKLDPLQVSAHRNLGRLLLARGDIFAARDELREAVRLDPYDSVSAFALGDVYVRLGNLDDALNFWTVGSDRRIAAEKLRVKAGEFISEGQIDLGISLLWKVIAYTPETDVAAYAYINLADVAKVNKDWEKARIYYEHALAIQPNNAESLGYIGWILGEVLNDPEEAIGYLQRATKYAPDYPWWSYMLAKQYSRLGMCADAIAAMTQAQLLFMKAVPIPPADIRELLMKWSPGDCK